MNWSTLILVLGVSAALIACGLRAQHRKKSAKGAGFVFLGVVVATHLIPLLGFPWPLLAEMRGGRYVHILSMQQARLFDVAEWGFATIVFAAAVRRFQAVWLLPLAVAAVALVFVAVDLTVRASGRAFYWDLWH